jgi:DNA adenine methylase
MALEGYGHLFCVVSLPMVKTYRQLSFLPVTPRPFVKWAGGKGQLLPELMARVPKRFNCYVEPFVGGGALFFHLQPEQAVLSDSNPELINLYVVIRDQVEELIEDLGQHVYDREYYYRLRQVDRTPEYDGWSAVEQASRLIYLNKTCYNGLYRVNSKGEFNVPFGRYKNPTILDENTLRACHEALQGVDIECRDFREVWMDLGKGDFVYFDPPYVPVSATAKFDEYTQEAEAEAGAGAGGGGEELKATFIRIGVGTYFWTVQAILRHSWSWFCCSVKSFKTMRKSPTGAPSVGTLTVLQGLIHRQLDTA